MNLLTNSEKQAELPLTLEVRQSASGEGKEDSSRRDNVLVGSLGSPCHGSLSCITTL